MDAAEQDVPGFMRSPKEHWKQISSTNPIERVSKEIKRRAKVLKPESAERLLTKQAVA
jgi:transposase-like protein